MHSILIVIIALLRFITAYEGPSKNLETNTNTYNGIEMKSPANLVFVEKENMLRLPALNYETKTKKKTRKSPKRTVQKIIKKNQKLRKVYFNQMKKQSTIEPKDQYEKSYRKEDKRFPDETTTQTQRKYKNRITKVVRNHVPFHKLQKKDPRSNDKRHKRGLSRELFILKDLDQIEFLSKEKDKDTVAAHITNYWEV